MSAVWAAAFVVRQDTEASGETLHRLPALGWLGRLLGTVEQLVEDNVRDAEAAGLGIEAGSQPGGPVPDHADAEIGVEQVAQR